MEQYDIGIIGSGPAGLAAAVEVEKSGFHQVIIERESRPGGILKQCIHDGFGLHRFRERLTGPEYAERFLKDVMGSQIPIYRNTFVSEITKRDQGDFKMILINSEKGIFDVAVKALILANGCRERTAKQVFIGGTRPAGVYTAGTAQYMTNILGYLPCHRCVILGSGDIGLIMARRLTLEGAEVLGVYEVKDTPSGLTRNLAQCLEDYNIPLKLSSTVTKVHGENRVEAVTVQKVDNDFNPIPGTEEIVECDGLILSVGLIPENELAKSLGIRLDPHTKGPLVDQSHMTTVPGCFSCGNALHVNDLVDYVSESAEIAARGAVDYVWRIYKPVPALTKSIVAEEVPIVYNDRDFLYVVPQKINLLRGERKVHYYFRSSRIEKNVTIIIRSGDEVLLKKKYIWMKPPEMETLVLDLGKTAISLGEGISFELVREVSADITED